MAIIIAEFCQNFNGDKGLLKEMIYAAAEAGADYAKIQAIFADDLSFRERFEERVVQDGVVKAIKRPYQAEYDRLRNLELCFDEYGWFVEECGKARIKPLVTAFANYQIKKLAEFGFEEIKIASYDCASYPMLRESLSQFKHLFISTGATYDSEIEEAAEILDGSSFSFLHCVTIYPTPLEKLHLSRMEYLRGFTSSVGFSDHTVVAEDGIKASAVALYLGADVIERHFTLLEPDQTRDGVVSIDTEQLGQLVELGRNEHGALGSYIEQEVGEYQFMIGQRQMALSEVELLNRDYYRGRFASKGKDGAVVFNWEDKEL